MKEINWKELKSFVSTDYYKNFVMFLDAEIERYNLVLDYGNEDMTQTFGVVKQRETIVDLKKKMNGWKTGNTKNINNKIIEDYN